MNSFFSLVSLPLVCTGIADCQVICEFAMKIHKQTVFSFARVRPLRMKVDKKKRVRDYSIIQWKRENVEMFMQMAFSVHFSIEGMHFVVLCLIGDRFRLTATPNDNVLFAFWIFFFSSICLNALAGESLTHTHTRMCFCQFIESKNVYSISISLFVFGVLSFN